MDVTGAPYSSGLNVRNVLLTESTSTFTPIETYNVQDDIRTIRISAKIAEESVVSRVPLPVSFKPISEITKLFDIIPISRGSTTSIVEHPQTSFMIKLRDNTFSDYACLDHLVAFEPALILHRLKMLFSILGKYASSIISEVPTLDVMIDNAQVTVIDMSKFDDRNMNTYAERLPRDIEVYAAKQDILKQYVRTSVNETPITFRDDLPIPVRERPTLYRRYIVPFTPVELSLYNMALQMLDLQYCHPLIVYKYLQDRAPPFLVVNDQIGLEMLSAGDGELLPRPVMEVLDYSLVYSSPLALNNLGSLLMSRIKTSIKVRSINEVSSSLSEIVNASSTVSNSASSAIANMNVAGVETIAAFIIRSVLNPNISYAIIGKLDLDAFNDFIYGTCLLLLQAITPPSAIAAMSRVRINNALAYFLLRYICPQPVYTRLLQNEIIPSLTNTLEWSSVDRDILAAIYSNLFVADGRIWNLVSRYYREVPPEEVTQVSVPARDTSYGINETRGISLPYLFGDAITEMRPDNRLNDYKQRLNLPPRSPILIANPMRNNVVDLNNVNVKMDFIMDLYDQNNFVKSPAQWVRNSASNSALLAKFRDSVSNITGILENVLSNAYSNAVNTYCDSVYRAGVPLNWKYRVVIDPKDMMFVIFGVCPRYVLMGDSIPDFFAGSEDILILQLVRAIWEVMSNHMGNVPTRFFRMEDVQKDLSEMVSIILSKKIDVTRYFTDDMRSTTFSKEAWERFIARQVGEELPPLYRTILDQVETINNYMDQMMAIMPIVDHFYVVRNSGIAARGSVNPILAATTLNLNQINTTMIIRDWSELVRLVMTQERVDLNTSHSLFEAEFYKLSEIASNEFVRSNERGESEPHFTDVEAIRVNMYARYELKIYKEQGEFSKPTKLNKVMHEDLTSFVKSNIGKLYPPVFTIPIDIMLNDLGECTSTKTRMRSFKVDEYFKCFTGAQVIIPLDYVNLEHVGSIQDLQVMFNGSVSVRIKPWIIKENFDVNYVQTGNHEVLIDPLPNVLPI
uniref:Major core capsid protein n=1 Tax=Rice gall dwarf virus TaxID=10986 RepID=Q6Q4H5_RGDV|nr:major core capsid protein [Rice gall dwarf virus]